MQFFRMHTDTRAATLKSQTSVCFVWFLFILNVWVVLVTWCFGARPIKATLGRKSLFLLIIWMCPLLCQGRCDSWRKATYEDRNMRGQGHSKSTVRKQKDGCLYPALFLFCHSVSVFRLWSGVNHRQAGELLTPESSSWACQEVSFGGYSSQISNDD